MITELQLQIQISPLYIVVEHVIHDCPYLSHFHYVHWNTQLSVCHVM